jgi:nitrite reductase/ring-hydroxylating ferredoxin subunit
VGLVGVTAYLGGHLSFVRGIGVNQTAFDKPRNRWSAVLGEDELPEGKLTRATVDGGIEIVMLRRGERVWALSNRCSHRGGPLFRGKVAGSDDEPSVVCPFHASVFGFEDGSIERGPAAVPQPAFEARIEGGKVEVRPKP